MAVMDASVYIALINSNEIMHSSSWQWLEGAQKEHERIYAPVILLAEVSAALSRGVDDPQVAHRVIQQLKGSSLIELIPVTRPLAEHAAEIAADHRIRGCDAIYVALAGQIGETLVTLDKQQLERAAVVVPTCKP